MPAIAAAAPPEAPAAMRQAWALLPPPFRQSGEDRIEANAV